MSRANSVETKEDWLEDDIPEDLTFDSGSARASDSLTLYLAEISKFPLLTKEEEAQLSKEVVKGCNKARERFIQSNLRLVVSLARKCHYRINGKMDLLDLINEGNMGLMKAVEKFNPELGYRFSTYAYWWINQYIERGVNNKARIIRLPVHVITKVPEVMSSLEFLSGELQRQPTIDEISRHSGVGGEVVERLLKLYGDCSSLNDPLATTSETTFQDTLKSDELTPDEVSQQQMVQKKIRSFVNVALTERERLVLSSRYGLFGFKEKTLDEISLEMNLSRERIRQIQSGAMEKVKQRISGYFPGFDVDHFLDNGANNA